MRKTTLIAALCLGAAAPLMADGTNLLVDDKSRLSYAIGMMFADRWRQQGLDVDPDLLLRGLKDGQSGGPALMSGQEMQGIITTLQQTLADRQQKMREAFLAKNKADGEALLAKNKTQPDITTLPDGLQYKVITGGDGEIPGDNDVVTVNYLGTFADGTAFDSSSQAGKPLELAIGRISVLGLNEALKLMKTGSKWRLFIPPELAYGKNGMSPRIPPDSTLIFDVELLAVQHPNAQTVAAPPPAAASPLTSDIIKVPSKTEMDKGAKIEILKSEDVQKLLRSQTNAAQ
jgi:FKBP-type peptidyl-prolyl cis-trans isomerase FklB